MPRKSKKQVTLALVYAKLVQHDRRFSQVKDQFSQMSDQINGQFAEVAKQIFRLEDSLRAEIASVRLNASWTSRPPTLRRCGRNTSRCCKLRGGSKKP